MMIIFLLTLLYCEPRTSISVVNAFADGGIHGLHNSSSDCLEPVRTTHLHNDGGFSNLFAAPACPTATVPGFRAMLSSPARSATPGVGTTRAGTLPSSLTAPRRSTAARRGGPRARGRSARLCSASWTLLGYLGRFRHSKNVGFHCTDSAAAFSTVERVSPEEVGRFGRASDTMSTLRLPWLRFIDSKQYHVFKI
ncbi:hypothetical protein PHLGIDRAFT_345346 [Phlebiopsis gigantea 11061_1 CR5-6]|uniref:Secreted protein n=1 Tax=Phlebiopsis gigantea (strain 11061_1 CR5-6) TaxID=745531 RepID=A0A0C3RPT0_PHLG1|nr:hypothetical protein PHLGIDRAFT_345346 [Phlebiopsis gigantea 11061_1 CR5-6]